jgi:hypothetical protein
MFQYGMIAVYFSFLLVAGTTMSFALSHADKTTSKSVYQSNLCRLMPDSAHCAAAAHG